jgi:hypothetical protein
VGSLCALVSASWAGAGHPWDMIGWWVCWKSWPGRMGENLRSLRAARVLRFCAFPVSRATDKTSTRAAGKARAGASSYCGNFVSGAARHENRTPWHVASASSSPTPERCVLPAPKRYFPSSSSIHPSMGRAGPIFITTRPYPRVRWYAPVHVSVIGHGPQRRARPTNANSSRRRRRR